MRYCYGPEKLGFHRIQRAERCENILFHDVSVDLSGLDVRVSHELLEHADINPVFEHVSGE